MSRDKKRLMPERGGQPSPEPSAGASPVEAAAHYLEHYLDVLAHFGRYRSGTGQLRRDQLEAAVRALPKAALRHRDCFAWIDEDWHFRIFVPPHVVKAWREHGRAATAEVTTS